MASPGVTNDLERNTEAEAGRRGKVGPLPARQRRPTSTRRPNYPMSLLSVLVLGVFLGMRHATDADHVVAVTTLVTRRQNTRAAMLLGALWGAGHGLTILIVGGAIILLGVAVPPRLGLSLELGVGVMLIALGASNLFASNLFASNLFASNLFASNLRASNLRASNLGAPGQLASTSHSHSQAAEPPTRGFRSFIIGVVHGLAGSAAVALLVLSTIRGAGLALLYLGLFGLGTVAGMMLLTTAMAFPLAAAVRRFGSLDRLLGSVTGAASMAFGIFLVYQIGFVDGLFGADPTWSPK